MEIVDLKRFPDFLKDFYRFPMQPMRFPDCFRHVENLLCCSKNESTYVISNWYKHAKSCFTKARSAERVTQLAIYKYFPRSSHNSAVNSTAKINPHDTVSDTAIDATDFSESEKECH